MSKTSSRSGRRQMQRRAIRSLPSNGRGSGRAKKYGKRAGASRGGASRGGASRGGASLMSRTAFERVIERLDPHATLVSHSPLKGGISAEITVLEIRLASGVTRRLIVRR